MANDDEKKVAQAIWSPGVAKAAVVALLGGLIGFAIVHSLHPFFAYADIPEMGLNPSDEEVARFIGAQKDFYGRNYAAGFAIIGACIGLLFAGLTVPTRKVPSAALASLLGAAGAAIAAYFAGGVTGVELAWSKDQSLVTAALWSFGIWGLMAVGIALGAAAFQGSGAVFAKSILSGLIAAILVVIANVLVSSIVFPGANLSDHIPLTLAERAVWIVVASATFGAAMAMGLKPAKTVETVKSEA